MVAVRKNTSGSSGGSVRLSKAEQKFMRSIKNPKPASEYLKKMFRLYGTGMVIYEPGEDLGSVSLRGHQGKK